MGLKFDVCGDIKMDLRVYESEKTLIDPSLIREARGIEGIEWQAGKGSKILERNDPDTFENIPLLQEVCSSIFPRSIFNAFELKPEGQLSNPFDSPYNQKAKRVQVEAYNTFEMIPIQGSFNELDFPVSSFKPTS
ncbi:hypothetical protein HZH66_014946 [Vespula vulgaris]|uniref:Uncharacterized protein n=1 Tax=Vespula vulgaris TaxID=7454 RepID=A0A834MNM2_VESVU|nr:hypothetical protein HZH66_014946 [Vespula vulgaris]